MKSRDVGIVFRKELLDLLRDRRSILATIVFPIALFPLLMFGSSRIQQVGERNLSLEVLAVSVEDATHQLEARLRSDTSLVVRAVDDPRAAIARREIFGAVVVNEPIPGPGEDPVRVTILMDDTAERSEVASNRLREHVETWQSELQAARIESIGATGGLVRAVEWESINLASEARMAGDSLGRFMPILLLFLLMNPASVAATDLFSGEKERKTIETLLTSKADRRSIVMGKFLTVILVAVLSTLLFLASSLFFSRVGAVPDDALMATLSLSVPSLLVVILVSIPLAIFLSAILVLVAAQAKSYKEAQTLLLPIMLAALLPAAASLLPGIRIDSIVALVPIANTALAMREALVGNFPVIPLALVILSNALYAGFVLMQAVSYIESEESILGERPPAPGDDTAGAAKEATLFGLATLLLFYYVGVRLQAADLLSGLLVSLWGIILGAAILFAAVKKLPAREAFALRAPRPLALAGAVLLAMPTLFAAHGLFALQSLFVPVPEQLFEAMEQMMDLGNGSLPLLVFAIAVSPGICEEAFFRGLVLGRYREARMPAWKAIFFSALLFGLFHLSIYRILPTATMGAVAGWLTWRTRSIFPAMLFHTLYNGTLVLGETYDFPGESLPTSPVWIASLVAAAVLGALAIASNGCESRSRA